jgi:hypothetical protein
VTRPGARRERLREAQPSPGARGRVSATTVLTTVLLNTVVVTATLAATLLLPALPALAAGHWTSG